MMEKIKAGEITGQTGDYMLRATAANGQIRAFAATSRDLVEKARQAHNTSPVATAALGRLMTAGVMMGSMMKADRDLLTIRVEGDGPIGGLTVTADKNGNVKGYAFHPEVMLPPNAKGKLDVGGALGVGVLSVIQDEFGKTPHSLLRCHGRTRCRLRTFRFPESFPCTALRLPFSAPPENLHQPFSLCQSQPQNTLPLPCISHISYYIGFPPVCQGRFWENL